MSESLTRTLEQNVLTLLCFDNDTAPTLMSSIKPDHFESIVYRRVATRAMAHYEDYRSVPGEAHIEDILEDYLDSGDEAKARVYGELIEKMYELYQGINKEFVLNNVRKFIRTQTVRAGITQAVKLVKEDKIDEAELAMQKALVTQDVTFDAGLAITDPRALSFLDFEDEMIFTGIEAFDKYGVCPAPKQLMIFLGLSGAGKTWYLCHVGKAALMQRKKVLHITLEMSEAKVMERYMMGFWGISKKQLREDMPSNSFLKDEWGKLTSVEREDIKAKMVKSFRDPDIREHLKKKIDRFGSRLDLRIKEFPTNTLTMSQLKAYLDGLERHHKWIPDIILLDYADLMKLDANSVRTDTGRIYKELRGLGVERNIPVVTATQSNRAGVNSKLITSENLSEDFSKAAIADHLITYNQTPEEKRLGLARLYVAKGRDEADKQLVLISQAYGIGQFCLDSAEMSSDTEYWDEVNNLSNEGWDTDE